MSKSLGSFADVLRHNGYTMAWYGKNHNVPDWQTSPAGPFNYPGRRRRGRDLDARRALQRVGLYLLAGTPVIHYRRRLNALRGWSGDVVVKQGAEATLILDACGP